MSALDILRRVTKPMSDAEAENLAHAKGAGRENASSDDPVSVRRAAELRAVVAKHNGTPRGSKKIIFR